MKKTQQWMTILLCVGWMSAAVQAGSANPDDVALALLMPPEISDTPALASAEPGLTEFNGRLDTARDDAYDYYVARLWLNPATGKEWITNAISVYPNRKHAQHGLAKLASKGILIPGPAVGEESFVVWRAATKTTAPNLAYRFRSGQYSAKVALNLPVATGQNQVPRWVALLHELALKQAARLDQLQKGKLKTSFQKEMLLLLPKKFAETTLLGTAHFSAREWRVMEHNFQHQRKIHGFQSGILRRFQLKHRPAEVVEVSVFKFDTPQAAQKFKKEIQRQNNPNIALPADLAESSMAKDFGDLLELQSLQGNYVIDVTVMAPFGTINKAMAKDQLAAFATRTLVGFRKR